MQVAKGIVACEDYYHYLAALRDQLDYEIDGIVYKVSDLVLQERLGFVAKHRAGLLRVSFRRKRRSPNC